jgi:hypothetical protein
LLDDRKTRKKLGVPEDRPEFVGCSNAVRAMTAPGAPRDHAQDTWLTRFFKWQVGSRFHKNHDSTPVQGTYVSLLLVHCSFLSPADARGLNQLYVTALVERGVDVLI